ncbi:MAG: hypothetical protein H7X97_03865, partial [Opitutaceae bacterium]|nr:hypothetical protein [Verrucomicrobiales bacterium]
MLTRIVLFVLFCCLGNQAFSATQTLTISTNGSGAVTRNPNNVAYPNGAVVTLTATPAGGWQFGSWSGDISGVINPTNVLMDSDKAITANFLAIPTYSLTVGVAGSGTVVPSSGSYLSNTV